MRAFYERLYRWLFANRGLSALSITAVFTALFLAFVFLVPQRPPYVVIDATTQIVRFEVTRPGLASVPIVNGTANKPLPMCDAELSGLERPVVTALLRPAQFAHLRYRWSKQAVVVELLQRTQPDGGSGELLFNNGDRCDLPSSISFRLPNMSTASQAAETFLPIAGPTEIGVELQEPQIPNSSGRAVSTMLLGGKVRVFGRPLLPHLKNNLYPAQGADFPLPTGGRLASGTPLSLSGSSTDAPAWFGVAVVGPRGLDVAATTESDELQFFRPGFGSDAETFAVGLLVRLVNDPSLAVFSVGLVVFALVGQLVSAWMGVWKSPPRKGACNATGQAPERLVNQEVEPKVPVPDGRIESTKPDPESSMASESDESAEPAMREG